MHMHMSHVTCVCSMMRKTAQVPLREGRDPHRASFPCARGATREPVPWCAALSRSSRTAAPPPPHPASNHAVR